ncbi:hypothetical protein C2G38_2251786 [Gigaspora rosea]|uniref:Uncharacterized protein n=1 Tax=Gigaspora rosea TaxID=44941 RepID=A0A397UNV1_9GLOM|nr:hypothetical protein C2G38_2251786 [Gigaspora rosea]
MSRPGSNIRILARNDLIAFYTFDIDMGTNSDLKIWFNKKVYWVPDPPLFGIPLTFNYTIDGINATTTSTYFFIGFFDENGDEPFDFQQMRIKSNLTNLEIFDLYIPTPLYTNSYSIMVGLADDFKGFIDCVTFPRFL